MGPLYLFRSSLDLTFLCAEKSSVFCVWFLFARTSRIGTRRKSAANDSFGSWAREVGAGAVIFPP